MAEEPTGATARALLLFTCTANRVRSPYAAAVARDHVERLGLSIEVRSAGLLDSGRSAVHEMADVARRRGYDLSAHRSTQVTPELLERADLVVTMTGEHVLDLVGTSVGSKVRVLTLREWAAESTAGHPIDSWDPEHVRMWAARATSRPLDTLLSGALDVADPIGRPKRFYRRAADEIETLLAQCFTTPDPNPARQ